MQEAAELPQRGEVWNEAGQGVPHQDQDRPSARGADQTGLFFILFSTLSCFIVIGERMQGCAGDRVQTAQRLEAGDSEHHRVQVDLQSNDTLLSNPSNPHLKILHRPLSKISEFTILQG